MLRHVKRSTSASSLSRPHQNARLNAPSHLSRSDSNTRPPRDSQRPARDVVHTAGKGHVSSGGITIRGAAGPYNVVAQNFAPGTTAEDIMSVMQPIGGDMASCRLLAANPTVIAEMAFLDKSGAEKVIAMFNNKRVSLLLSVSTARC